ncbi:MAG: molybdopterin-dependent oxidoreductase [Tateyamaria sp.]
MVKAIYTLACALMFTLFLGWHSGVEAQSATALEITGVASGPGPIYLELADLDAMPQVTFETSTIWTDGTVMFSGVPLKALLGELSGQSGVVEMVALNDYKVDMPLNRVEDGAPILATRMNGETMSVRDKGPYWVVFPYDSDTKYQTETTYAWSIWQLNRLKVVD